MVHLLSGSYDERKQNINYSFILYCLVLYFEFSAPSCPQLVLFQSTLSDIATNDLKCHQTGLLNIITVT